VLAATRRQQAPGGKRPSRLGRRRSRNAASAVLPANACFGGDPRRQKRPCPWYRHRSETAPLRQPKFDPFLVTNVAMSGGFDR
jgi:hypothetical protein